MLRCGGDLDRDVVKLRPLSCFAAMHWGCISGGTLDRIASSIPLDDVRYPAKDLRNIEKVTGAAFAGNLWLRPK